MSAPARPPIALVVVAAVADNGVIGRDGGLPWRLSSDMKHFRATTLGHPVVMGRKTCESLPAPLVGRTGIVVSRDAGFTARGAVVTSTLPTALALARADALRRDAAAIMLIGGAALYEAALPLADRLEITHVHARPDGDAVFPHIDPAIWVETARRHGVRGAKDDADFTFATYVRRSAPRGFF